MVRAAPHGKAAGLAGPASAVSWPAVETSWKDQLLATSATFAGIAARCCDYLPPDTHQGTTARSLPLCIVITFLEFLAPWSFFKELDSLPIYKVLPCLAFQQLMLIYKIFVVYG